MKIILSAICCFIFLLTYAQKGMSTAHRINPGSNLSSNSFVLIYPENQSSLDKKHKLQLCKIIKDFNEIKNEGEYSSIYIVITINGTEENVQLQYERALIVLDYLLKNETQSNEFTISRLRFENIDSISNSDNLMIVYD